MGTHFIAQIRIKVNIRGGLLSVAIMLAATTPGKTVGILDIPR
jgi:hypothetical protein